MLCSQWLSKGWALTTRVYSGGSNNDQHGFRLKNNAIGGNLVGGILVDELPTYNDNTWRHYIGVRQGDKFRFYMNGVLVQEQTIPSASTYDIDINTRLRIGRQGNFGSNYFKGQIDDLRIYNRALSQADIEALYAINPLPCNADHEAVMLFNKDKSTLEYCNSTDWIAVGGGGDDLIAETARAAYSLRDVTSTNPSVIRVRRSSDDAEQDGHSQRDHIRSSHKAGSGSAMMASSAHGMTSAIHIILASQTQHANQKLWMQAIWFS